MKRPDLIVGLDFESYYDTQYSLSRKETSLSEYVRDDRFEAISCAIRTNQQRKSRVFFGNEILPALESIDWENAALLAHNTAFDGLILSHHYGIIPSYYYDSLSMARVLVSHDCGAGLDEISQFYGRKGKVGGGRALTAVKGKHLTDLTEHEREELGKYNIGDVDEMWWLFNRWIKKYPQDELDLIHYTINAFCNPVLEVDKPRVIREIKRAVNERNVLFKKVANLLDLRAAAQAIQKNSEKRRHYAFLDEHDRLIFLVQTALRSRNEFAKALRKQQVKVPTKRNAKGTSTFAFAKNDLEFIALGKHPKEPVRDLYEAKLEANSSINITRATRLLQRVERPGWKLPIALNYCKAHTFRWSGGDKFNPQNLPARGRNGAELRRSIIAPRGYKIVVADSSQIEARTNAWYWDHKELLATFALSDLGKSRDPYCLFADSVYHREITPDDVDERFVGKVAVLGLGYQMGGSKYQHTLESGQMGPSVVLSLRKANKIVDIWREKNAPIVKGWQRLEINMTKMIERQVVTHKCTTFDNAEIHMPNGLSLHYPELHSETGNYIALDEDLYIYKDLIYRNGKSFTHIYGGKLNENIIQSLARIIVGQQMLRIAEKYRVVMMSHDEVVYLAPEKEAENALEFGLEQMRWVPDWCTGIPLNAEGKIAKYYPK